jgi:hypothetical protein
MYSPQHDPEQLAVGVIRALGTLSSIDSFENLRIFSNPPSSFTLKSISNLTTFRMHWSWDSHNSCLPEIASLLARCPQLTEVYLRSESYSTDTQDTALHDIFAEVGKSETILKLKKLELSGVVVNPNDFEAHVQHLRDLTFLGITNNPSSKALTAFGTTCNILQKHNDVYLKGVVTDLSGDPLLLSYLSSYSGLTKLCLGLQDNKEDFIVVNRIYTQILPIHSKTLEYVELGSVRSSSWCQLPTKEQLAGLVKCQHLRVLKVRSIADPERLMQNDGTIFVSPFIYLFSPRQVPTFKLSLF